MFHLEQSISAWRSQMLAAGIQSPVPLDELEAHLRDDIARQMESGIDAQTAFESVIQKIGTANILKREFAKVQTSPASRLLIVVFVPIFVSFFSISVALLLLFNIGSFSEVDFTQKLSGFAAAAATAIFGWSGFLAQRLFPVISNKRARDTICIGGGVLQVLWWFAFFFLVLQRSEFTLGGLDMAILWGFGMPFGILAGLSSGLEKAATRYQANDGQCPAPS
jgi:hypothetical protein